MLACPCKVWLVISGPLHFPDVATATATAACFTPNVTEELVDIDNIDVLTSDSSSVYVYSPCCTSLAYQPFDQIQKQLPKANETPVSTPIVLRKGWSAQPHTT